MKPNALYKGSLNTILLKLLEENGRMYGYEMTQKVKELTQGKVKITEGALYPALHKLEAEGILEVEMVEMDHRVRKYYRLTQKGKVETQTKLQELEEFIQQVQKILSPTWKLS